MNAYIHRVAYYETDRMGITHHSNYVRWMEEARVDYMDQLGWNYARLEDAGISSPVLDVTCSYKKPTTFDDRVAIQVAVAKFSGVRTTFTYTMHKLDEEGNPAELVCVGTTNHCFINKEGKPMRVTRELPVFACALQAQADAYEGE